MENNEQTNTHEHGKKDPKHLVFGIILILVGIGLIAWTLTA